MKQTKNRLPAELWRAAGPTIVCIVVLCVISVMPPVIAAVTHAYARMSAQYRGEHLSIADMTPGEKDAIMTKHHLKLLAYLHTQFLNADAREQAAEREEAEHPSPRAEQTIRLQQQCIGFIVNNYNGIAQQTAPGILDRARLPHEIP